MANLLRSLSKITRIPLLLGLCFLSSSIFSCSTESSSGDDMQDNGLALMKQIVEPTKVNMKKEKELWGNNDGESTAEDLATYNEYGNTIKEQIKRVKEHPEDTQAYLDLVEALEFREAFNPHTDNKSQEKAYREMARWLTTAIKNQPDDKELYRKRAEVYFDNEQYQKAQADYTHIIAMDSQDGDAFVSRGRVHEAMGHLKKAQQDFDAYAHIQPGTADQYYRRGLFHYVRGHFNLAEPDFTKNIELDPIKGSGYIFRAEIYFAQNRFEDSIADYKKMLELDSYLTGFGLARMGINYYYQGNYKMAELVFTEGLKLDPDLGTVVAWYLSRQKQGKSSKVALQHIANHFSDEHLEGAVIHLFLDKISPGALLVKKLDPPGITADHSSSSAYYYAGQYYLMRGNTDKARAMFEKSIQVSKKRFAPGNLFSEKELEWLNSSNASNHSGEI